MAKTEDEIRNRRIDLLYKNLEHVSGVYFAVESVFPLWEATFALIIGQLFIAYFDKGAIQYQKSLAFLGFALSFFWLALVSLNLKNAQHMANQIEELHNHIADELSNCPTKSLKFVKPWPKIEKKNWYWLGNILSGRNPKQKEKSESKEKKWKEQLAKIIDQLFDLSKSSWLWRRMLPVILIISWSFLIWYALADP